MAALEKRPLRTFIQERETLIPRKKLVDILEVFGIELTQVPLPANVRPEQAVEVVAGSSWARGLAEGVCGPGYAGFSPGTPEFERCVFNVSHKVAAGTLGIPWTPPTGAPAPARRRR